MFIIQLISSIAFALVLSLQVHAHAGITPALGVVGNFTRSDVQRPSNGSECGSINIANNINNSTTVPAAPNGSFIVDITNFNGGDDGSTFVTLLVDPSGTGESFVPGNVTVNGLSDPNTTYTQEIVATLPVGTLCVGGASGNLCLASFTTTAGFGNCVVVQQLSATTNTTTTSSLANSTTVGNPSTTSTTSTSATPSGTAHHDHDHHHDHHDHPEESINRRFIPVGTRAARALLRARRDPHPNVEAVNWIWG